MAKSLYDTEQGMKVLVSDVVVNPAAEIAETQRYLQYGNLNKADTATATAYLNDLIKNNPTITDSTSVTSTGQSPYAGAGMSDADRAILEAYQNNPTNNSTDTATQQGIAGGDGSNSILGWIQSRSGDVAIIVMGMMVVGVALFSSSRVRDTVINVAGKAAGVPGS